MGPSGVGTSRGYLPVELQDERELRMEEQVRTLAKALEIKYKAEEEARKKESFRKVSGFIRSVVEVESSFESWIGSVDADVSRWARSCRWAVSRRQERGVGRRTVEVGRSLVVLRG